MSVSVSQFRETNTNPIIFLQPRKDYHHHIGAHIVIPSSAVCSHVSFVVDRWLVMIRPKLFYRARVKPMHSQFSDDFRLFQNSWQFFPKPNWSVRLFLNALYHDERSNLKVDLGAYQSSFFHFAASIYVVWFQERPIVLKQNIVYISCYKNFCIGC